MFIYVYHVYYMTILDYALNIKCYHVSYYYCIINY